MHFQKTLAFTLAMCGANSVFAAMTANIDISGKVVPTVCGIVASQVKLDLGDIKPDVDKKVAEITRPLGTLTLTCAAPTLVNISYTSSGIKTNLPQVPAGWSQGGQSLSALWVAPTKVTANGASANLGFQETSGNNWTIINGPDTSFMPVGMGKLSFLNSTTSQPVAITTGTLDLSARFHEIPKVDFSKGEISANQTLTFELKYL